MDITEARQTFARLRETDGTVDPDELDAVWAALDVVRPEALLGRWKGGEFVTGHRMNGMLERIGWYGKTFSSLDDAQPLVCRGSDGELYSDLTTGKGAASLWMVEFRGESTATMVYDGQPVLDHFKQVDESTVLGIMNGKGVLDDERHFYFFLERA
ncbi:GXWXG protein [Mumia flava]|uniref:GXWXG protein n=1 Tax=Mumia flava TaxID=1348852 RepID=A0A0B2BTY5_9ACTN|nr:DUF4334 domain-containing protein [Mumia flava]PJJ57168.1 GXWXG protein [Mumia flava]